MQRINNIVFIALLLSVSLLAGCQMRSARTTLQQLKESSIVLPERMTCIRGGKEIPVPETLRSSPKLVIFIDSTECTACRISQFKDYQDLFDLSEETGKFEVVVLLSSPKEKYRDTYHEVEVRRFPFPVYLDTENRFLAENAVIPPAVRYHALSLDGEGHVLLVGDPTRGNALMNMFKGVYQIDE